MAPRQTSTDSSSTDSGSTGGIDQGLAAAIAAALAQTQQRAPSQPIGVPYYQIDPATGQPAKDASGQPVRWHPTPAPNTTSDQGQLVHGTGSAHPPRYFDGDQWLPGSLPPDQLSTLQKAMVQAGLLKPGQAQLGVWDQSSMAAYSQLLAYANSAGSDVSTALQQWGAAHTANPDSTPHTPLTVKVTNPDDLRQVFRAAYLNTTGIGVDSAKIDQMVQAYQGVETQAQQQQYAMTGSGSPTDPGTGGTIVAPPNPQAFAEAKVRQEDPTGVAEHDALGAINQFHQLIGGWK